MAAVELSTILAEQTFDRDILSYHSGGLNRPKIDVAVEAAGYPTPLPNKVSFHLYKMNNTTPTDVWLVTWIPMMNQYAIEKLTLK